MSDSNFRFDPPVFVGYMEPHGWLTAEPETHALFNYYLCARKTVEENWTELLAYEGEEDSGHNFKQLFTSVARMYNVAPEAMAKCWDRIDKQCDLLHLPRMPDEERYRFSSQIIITDLRKPH